MAIKSLPNKRSIVSATTTTPPVSPNTTDFYIIPPSGATGAWAGQGNKITRWNGSSWDFATPNKEILLWAADTRKIYLYNVSGSNFDVYTPNAGSGSIIVKESDGTPSVSGVTEIRFPNGTLTDNGSGIVTISTGAANVINIKEVDNVPNGNFSTLVVPNGSLTDNGSGSASLVFPSLTVKELDAAPNVINVTEIRVSNGTLTDNGGGSVTLNNAPANVITIQELDGTPTGSFSVFKVPNASLTNNGDGSATLTFPTPYSLTVKESDGTPSISGVVEIRFSNGTVTDNGSGIITVNNAPANSLIIQELDGTPTGSFTTLKVSNTTLTNNGDGSATLAVPIGLTVSEIDGTPSINNVTQIKFTNGTVTDNTGGVVTINTSGSGSGNTTGTGTLSGITSPALAGNLYFPTDSISIARDTGTTWEYWGNIYKLKTPISTNFTWVNQGTATVSDANGAMVMTCPTSASENVRLLKKSLVATSNYTVICGFIPQLIGNSYKNVGLMLRDSVSGKLIGFSSALAGITRIETYIYQWSNNTTFVSSPSSLSNFFPNDIVWFKIQDNGTNRIYSVGTTKYNFTQIYSETRTNFITPNEVGMYVNQVSSDYQASCTFLHFEEF